MLAAHLLFLLLTLPPTSHGCRTAPSAECDKPKFVPGHNLVGEGFNIVKMTTTGAFVVNTRAYLEGGDHGNCTLCDNKLMKQEQKLPTSVVDWRIKVRCRRSVSAKTYDTGSSLLRDSASAAQVGWKVGLSVPFKGGAAVGGTHSKSARFAQSHSATDRFSYTSHSFSCRYYTFRIHSNPPLTKEFEGSIKSLPLTYNSKAKDLYKHFISIYGTHFLRQVDLGGRVHSITAVRTCDAAMKGLSVHVVSNCLSAEASYVVKGVKINGAANYCKDKSKKLENGKNFSVSFSDRVTEVLGGSGEEQDILFNPDQKNGYATWLKTLKTLPGVVSYRLSSLHMLVKNDTVRRANLQKAISEYITNATVYTSCASRCKVGHRAQNCACKCSGHQKIDANCCPSALGVAQLSVTVIRAEGLWGDYFSKTDGYVKVFYGTQGFSTHVIHNNNFPKWNHRQSLGMVDLTKRIPIRFEVWDRDNKWDDDLLGRYDVVPQSGSNIQKSKKLKHGSLYISFTATCAPSLQGSLCAKYAPTPNGDGRLIYHDVLNNPERPSFFKGLDQVPKDNGFL
ncbi:perforin-1.3 [Chanos chanos]|uniref:Perforin-1.3 n=1 Tax=Chanos chanos TaxID=29144 RepID=A0A6J2WY67_CHACN|nr:perforin-1-like [Chanos chanos]